LAAIEQDNLAYRFEPLDLVTILEEAIRSVEFLVEEKEGTIRKDYEEGAFIVQGDHNELVHVLMNLLVNSCKYSPDKLDIGVLIKRSKEGIQVEITDKGMGIAPNERKRIFEKYYRISSGNEHNAKGFGIGLYYVREVLKAHHATITVESELGKGSRFILHFPKLAEQ
jgi:two-component system phosphate regulon sensor histidine kinase PhoR